MNRKLSLRNVDLNLLPILHALIEEESVKGASERVHLSQSATSSALRRIRDTLNDPVLEPHGSKMRLTAKAKGIKPLLSDNLRKTASILGHFVPTVVDSNVTQVRICGPEHVLVALAGFMDELFDTADENTIFEFKDFYYNSVLEQVRDGEVDLAIGPFDEINLPSGLKAQRLYNENLIVAMRHDHPAVNEAEDGQVSASSLERYKHVVASQDDSQDGAALTQLLIKKNIDRQVMVKMPGLILLGKFLRSSNLIAIGTERVADEFHQVEGLVVMRPPQELIGKPFNISLVWRSELEGQEIFDRARQCIVNAAKELKPL
ncbi:MAG: LysR family transcriptional regulator [Acidiferrobacterales bacterium]|nr:LysR family transcriptional regulator [Acidiferrobacterales bacterium]